MTNERLAGCCDCVVKSVTPGSMRALNVYEHVSINADSSRNSHKLVRKHDTRIPVDEMFASGRKGDPSCDLCGQWSAFRHVLLYMCPGTNAEAFFCCWAARVEKL